MPDAPKTVRVRGGGGWELDMDVPPEGTHARELYEQKLANGDLVLVDQAKPRPARPAKPAQ